jgi:tetratricopeptide (TPR) repeat protein
VECEKMKSLRLSILVLSVMLHQMVQAQGVAAPARAARSATAAKPTATTPSSNPSPQPIAATDTADSSLQIQRSVLRAAIDPDLMRAYKALGQNQFAQAREIYSQVLTLNSTQRDALLGIAYAHQALGNTDQALSTLRRLIELYPRDSDALSALYLIGGGDLQAEETRFKQLLERSDQPAAVHYTLGVLYFDQARYGESERAFSRAFALSPNQPDYAYNLALALDHLGRSREAARQYVQALNLSNQTSAVFSRDLARARLRILTAAP